MSGKPSVERGQTWKSKNKHPDFGYSTIEILDVLTSETASVTFKYEDLTKHVALMMTMSIDTIQKEFHLL